MDTGRDGLNSDGEEGNAEKAIGVGDFGGDHMVARARVAACESSAGAMGTLVLILPDKIRCEIASPQLFVVGLPEGQPESC